MFHRVSKTGAIVTAALSVFFLGCMGAGPDVQPPESRFVPLDELGRDRAVSRDQEAASGDAPVVAKPLASRPVTSSVVLDRRALERELQGASGIGDVVQLRPALGLTGLQGIEVTGIPEGSPVAGFGLKAGDVVKSLNGIDLTALENAAGLMESLQDASTFDAVVLRGGTEVRIQVKLQ